MLVCTQVFLQGLGGQEPVLGDVWPFVQHSKRECFVSAMVAGHDTVLVSNLMAQVGIPSFSGKAQGSRRDGLVPSHVQSSLGDGHGKRTSDLPKGAKVHVRDSGVLCLLLGVPSPSVIEKNDG